MRIFEMVMNKLLKNISYLSVVILILYPSGNIIAQNSPGKERTRLYLNYEKLSNNDKKLKVTLSAGRGKDLVWIEGASVTLYESANDSTVKLAEIITDESGRSELIIKSGYHFIKDEDGFIDFSAVYNGNDSYRRSSNEILIKDVQVDLTTALKDSVKTVSISVYENNSEGNRVPVEGLDLSIGVQRLFSILQVGQIQTDVEGKGSIQFPDDLPGDSLGMVQVIARIDDNEFYGTVSSRNTVDWGTPVSYELKPLPRQLWTNEAPLWMIFSVFIILSAAWFHFVVAIINIRKVKKAV